MQLPDKTAAKQTLKECESKTKNSQGKPKLHVTWLKGGCTPEPYFRRLFVLSQKIKQF